MLQVKCWDCYKKETGKHINNCNNLVLYMYIYIHSFEVHFVYIELNFLKLYSNVYSLFVCFND